MYQLFRLINLKHLYVEIPALLISLAISELFYKFGSFTLEAIAFLATWYIIGLVMNKLGKTNTRL